jgi:hypothetical protein
MDLKHVSLQTRRNYTSLAFCVSILSLNSYSKQMPKLCNGMGALTIVYNLDLKEQSVDYIIHHTMGLILGGIIAFNSYTFNNPGRPPEIFDSWVNFEVSTIFLCLYYIFNKHSSFKAPFLISFVYYRFYNFIPANFSQQARDEIDHICTDHYLIEHGPCVNMMNGITMGLITLNTLWLRLMIKKMNKEFGRRKITAHNDVKSD